MKRLFAAAVFTLLGASLAVAVPLDAFNNQKGSLDIAGGTAHIPVMKLAAQAIMERYPDIRITVAGGGSGVGVQKVGEGLVQIGNTGRALKDTEIAKYGLVTFPFAIDGVAVAVNPANGVTGLTKAQVKDVFAGKVTNWKDLGGADAPISLYVREDGSGTRETFEERALDKGTGQNPHRLRGHRSFGRVRQRSGRRRHGPQPGGRGRRQLHRHPPAVHEHQRRARRTDQTVCGLHLFRGRQGIHFSVRLHPLHAGQSEVAA